jgi:hypothetical protein
LTRCSIRPITNNQQALYDLYRPDTGKTQFLLIDSRGFDGPEMASAAQNIGVSVIADGAVNPGTKTAAKPLVGSR